MTRTQRSSPAPGTVHYVSLVRRVLNPQSGCGPGPARGRKAAREARRGRGVPGSAPISEYPANCVTIRKCKPGAGRSGWKPRLSYGKCKVGVPSRDRRGEPVPGRRLGRRSRSPAGPSRPLAQPGKRAGAVSGQEQGQHRALLHPGTLQRSETFLARSWGSPEPRGAGGALEPHRCCGAKSGRRGEKISWHPTSFSHFFPAPVARPPGRLSPLHNSCRGIAA